MKPEIAVVMVRDMGHLYCAPSILVFQDESLAITYICNVLPDLIATEVGFPVRMRQVMEAAPFSKFKAESIDGEDDPQVTVTVESQVMFQRSQ